MLRWRIVRLGTLACIALSAVTSHAAEPKETGKLLAKDVSGDWEKAGAKSGWMGANAEGYYLFQTDQSGLTNPIPAFRFYTLKPGVVAKLRAPAAPFGLDLSLFHISGEVLKEFAALKNLRALNLI